MLAALAIAALTILPVDDVARESVDLVELNHFYDEHGRLIFDQTIFYDWSPEEGRYNVRAWRLVRSRCQLPQRTWPQGYLSSWVDGEQTRQIWSQAFRETWTQFDPELVEREILPKEKRRGLRPSQRTSPCPIPST